MVHDVKLPAFCRERLKGMGVQNMPPAYLQQQQMMFAAGYYQQQQPGVFQQYPAQFGGCRISNVSFSEAYHFACLEPFDGVNLMEIIHLGDTHSIEATLVSLHLEVGQIPTNAVA